jgi:hypothetical protein
MVFDGAPTLSMQGNPTYVNDEQRSALDAYAALIQQCRNKMAEVNLQLWKVIVQINPNPTEYLKELYDRKITLGQYNAHRQEILDKFSAAMAGLPK